MIALPLLSAMMNCKTDELNNYLESLKRKVEYKHWFFGHHHINHTFPGGKTMLFTNK